MPDLFSSWSLVAQRLSAARSIALFLDFDGTLAAFKPRPADVHIHPGVRRSLARLARSPRFQVCIITGRRHADISARIAIRRIHYLGLHGWDDGQPRPLDARTSAALAELKHQACNLFPPGSGVWLEDKGESLAVHDRGHPNLRQAVAALYAPCRNLLRLAPARRVWEFVPRELGDKGLAVRRRLHALADASLPIYVGDDRIDEAAFHSLARGITVHVGRRRQTHARYSLAGVPQVQQLLLRMAQQFA